MPGYRSSYRTKKRTPGSVPADGSVTVSSVRASSSDPTRVNIRVDGVLMGRLDIDLARSLDLKQGTVWDEHLIERVGAILEDDRALRGAVRLLAARDRSRRELQRALAQRGHTGRAIEAALDRLVNDKLIDDERYAHNKAHSIARSRVSGPRYIEAKLRAKGIDMDQARHAASEALEGVDQTQAATELAERWAASLPASLEPEARKRRLIGRLARRGFDHDTVRKAVETALRA